MFCLSHVEAQEDKSQFKSIVSHSKTQYGKGTLIVYFMNVFVNPDCVLQEVDFSSVGKLENL